METLTETPVEEAPVETDVEKTEELEERDPARLKQRKPPESGLCRRCGGNKPVNQLMLCYPCWVKTVLEEKAGWREGMPHPDWCRCEGVSDHSRRSDGN